jgi:hypothetical protein
MGKRFVLTVMMFTRCFLASDLNPDLTSVVKPPSGDGYVIPRGFIKKVVKDFRLKDIDLSFNKRDVYLSTKASINGPATSTA